MIGLASAAPNVSGVHTRSLNWAMQCLPRASEWRKSLTDGTGREPRHKCDQRLPQRRARSRRNFAAPTESRLAIRGEEPDVNPGPVAPRQTVDWRGERVGLNRSAATIALTSGGEVDYYYM